MLSALAHRMLRARPLHLWITFVFVSNTCVSLGITKTSPEDHGTLLAFHALCLRFTICILVYCTIARTSSFSGQCERLSRRLVYINSASNNTSSASVMLSCVIEHSVIC
jgi:hypothetical protein